MSDGELVGHEAVADELRGDERYRLGAPGGRKSQDPLAAIVEGVSDYAIFMLNREGYVLTWNVGAERIKGYRSAEIVGRHFSVFYPESDVAAGLPERELEEAEAKGAYQDEGWRVRRDGSTFWASVSITPLRTEAGRLRGFAKVVRDDTERRRAVHERARLEVLEERERIAHALYQDLVQELFSVGLSLEGSVALAERRELRARLEGDVEALDRVVRHIRETVWADVRPDEEQS